jgi:hypothetical protein
MLGKELLSQELTRVVKVKSGKRKSGNFSGVTDADRLVATSNLLKK